jgi:hypothetical protein
MKRKHVCGISHGVLDGGSICKAVTLERREVDVPAVIVFVVHEFSFISIDDCSSSVRDVTKGQAPIDA